MPPILYAVRFDNRRKLVDSRIDLRRFIVAYDQQTPKSERVGRPSEWVIDVVAESRKTLVMYMSSPLFQETSFQQNLPRKLRGRQWFGIRTGELMRHQAQLGPALTSQLAAYVPGFGSPVAYLKALRGMVSKGPVARIDGVVTNTYRRDVDFTKNLNLLPGFLKRLVQATTAKFHAIVSVDGSSTVRRVQLTSEPLPAVDGGHIVVTIDPAGLGLRPVIAVPVQRQVVDLTALPSD